METLQIVVRSLAGYGRRPAIVALRKRVVETWRFADLADHVRRLATGLSEAALARGAYGVLFAPNCPEWIIACLALITAGAVPVPIDAQAGDDDLRHILKDCGARWIFTTSTLAERVESISFSENLTFALLDGGEHDARSWRRYLAGQAREFRSVEPEDPAVLFYTSGTTGPPKGVPLTHRNLTSNLQALLDEKLLAADDRLLLPLPLHHVYPFTIGMLTPLISGVPIVFPSSLLGPQILRALKEEHITIIVAVPRFYSALYAAVETRLRQRGRVIWALFQGALNLSISLRRRFGLRLGRRLFAPLHRRLAPRLRMVVSGGAALDPDLAWTLEGLGWEVASGYGLTETSPMLTFNLPGRGRLDSAGRPLPGVTIRIAELEQRAAYGEVLARGPNVFSGYRNLPEKTKQVFTKDGYFRTGDLGYLKDGYLYLVGRTSSMIVLPGGENINPERVEEVLERGEHIREAAVLQKDHRLVALLVPDPTAVRCMEEQDLERLIRREVQQQSRLLPSHHRVSEYAIVFDPLPRTRLGKIRRHKLEDVYEQVRRRAEKGKQPGPIPIETMTPEDRQLLEDRAARRVWEWLPDRFPHVRLTPDTDFRLDLNVDSLDWLNLTLELRERIGIDLDDDAVGRIETVRDLLREAAEAAEADGAGADPLKRLQRPLELLDEQQQRWLKPQGPIMRIVGNALLSLARLLVKGLFGLNVCGRDHLPRQGPFVLTPNHTSFLDPLALAAALPRSVLHRTYWSGWTGIMFVNPIMRLVSRATRVVPVDQQQGVLSSLAFGAAILDRGHILVWFPEGGRSPSGKLQPFQPGIGFLLRARCVPVVPARIEGGHEALPPAAWRPRFRSLTVIFGEPVDPEELQRHGQGAEPHHRIATALHDRVEKLKMTAE